MEESAQASQRAQQRRREEDSCTHVEAVSKAASSSSSPSRQYLNGRCERSTREIVSVITSVPALMLQKEKSNRYPTKGQQREKRL
jgi:hypothetical protein